jgi:hypothetical protein
MKFLDSDDFFRLFFHSFDVGRVQGISNMMWGCASMGVAPGADLVARVDQRAVEIMGQFNPQELSNLVWACGVLCIRPSSGLLQAVEARFGDILHCSPAQVSPRLCVGSK